ncbi:MAG: single-stranded-DNA-specific exonuclease RecJ [Patescibacteria group bacterium]|jgi:single-stranded-DNA-specific exonuclease
MIWKIKDKLPPELIRQYPDYNELVLQLLFSRGLTERKQIEEFLNPDFDRQLFDPYLFKDMRLAVERLFKALLAGEHIMVYGDYDADGVCSTAILFQTLSALGACVDTYIPFRESEGYGLNTKIVQQLINQKFNLVITVDCGIANKKEIAEFTAAGIDVIILDHHEEPLELPQALAIIDPHVKSCGYPQSPLCGAGVAFKFVQAIIKYQQENNSPIQLPEGYEKWLLDLAAIATVGDIVPLLGENRIIVKYGLTVMEKTRNLGLAKMMELVNNRRNGLDTEYLGWRIVPRINAAGRVDHASVAFNLLTAATEEEAERWAQFLEDNNKERQQITGKILEEAFVQVAKSAETEYILIAEGEGWAAGVVGLVAGRLADKYRRPALVFTKEGDKYLASGRSIEEFDITEALKQCDDLLSKYGGHPQACGLTIIGEDSFIKFKEKIRRLAKEKLMGLDLTPTLLIDAEIKLSQINWQLLEGVVKFEPFGEDNERPLFAAFGLAVEQVQTVGADGKHLKVLVSQNGDLANLHKLIGFSFGEWCARLKAGDKIDIVFELGVNEWNGNKELQLKIEDLKLSK